jgi:mono/diheme cytochrome c family protein
VRRRRVWLTALACASWLLAVEAGAAPTEDPAAVERGRYLAHAANCVSCHTRAGGEPFAGGLAFETPLGTLHSTNITSDTGTGIGGWSLDDLRRALREGIRADGAHLFPVFPYPAYTRLRDAEIADLYAWLRTLAPVSYTPPANGWLLRLRWPMAVWNWLFLDAGPYRDDPSRDAEWNRGAFLVQGPGHCGSCHTPRNWLLAERSDRALQGALIHGEVASGKQRPWYAVDLSGAPQGLASWKIEDLVGYFQKGFSARGASSGPMNEVIGNSLRHLESADLRAMAVYLKSLPGTEYTGVPVAPHEIEAGAAIYARRCKKCHGASGRGGFFSGPPLAGNPITQGAHPASLINLILYGSSAPKALASPVWETMPALADALSDEDVAAVSNYVRGSWENRAPAVSAADVQRQR